MFLDKRIFNQVVQTIIIIVNVVFSPLSALNAESLQQINAILRIEPHNVMALNARGIEQARDGDLIGAINTWRYALNIDPNYIHLYNNIGSALRRLGYREHALSWYRAALRIQPTYWTWFNLGLLYEDLGKLDEAQSAYKESLLLCPEFSQAEERIARLKRMVEIAVHPKAVSAVVSAPTHLQDATKVADTSTSMPAELPQHMNSKVTVACIKKKPAVDKVNAIKNTKPEKHLVRVIPVKKRTDGGDVFLTFDGGAEAAGLLPILEALQARGVKSTFFLTGKWIKEYPEFSRRILADGHEIANHSMSHLNMAHWSKEKIANELRLAENTMQSVTGCSFVPFFRFPFGAQNRTVERFVEESGYKAVYWDIDTLDWKEPPVASILQKVSGKVKSGSVILMHVGSRNGPKALPAMLDELLARGFHPRKLSELNPIAVAALPCG